MISGVAVAVSATMGTFCTTTTGRISQEKMDHGSFCSTRTHREEASKDPELGVVGTEVVAPLRAAVRLVDDEPETKMAVGNALSTAGLFFESRGPSHS